MAMRAVKGKDTSPELVVRRICCELGERGYRLHRRDILGAPDVAYVGRRIAVFVHGYFWHGHCCKAGAKTAKTAKTNSEYWQRKIERNVARDALHIHVLKGQGWRVMVLWECELKDEARAKQRLARLLLQQDRVRLSLCFLVQYVDLTPKCPRPILSSPA